MSSSQLRVGREHLLVFVVLFFFIELSYFRFLFLSLVTVKEDIVKQLLATVNNFNQPTDRPTDQKTSLPCYPSLVVECFLIPSLSFLFRHVEKVCAHIEDGTCPIT